MKQRMPEPSPKELKKSLSSIMSLQSVDKAVLVSLRNNFVFTRIPKVANSSIKNLIYRMESFHPQVEIRENLTHDIHYGPMIRPSMLGFNSPLLHRALFSKNFYRFTFVRNPYARALSNYLDRYMSQHSTVRRQVDKSAHQLGLWSENEGNVSFFVYLQAIAAMKPRNMDIHITPQVTESLSDLISYDFIGSFETLSEDLTQVAERVWQGRKIDLGFQSPSRTNATEKLREYFTDADVALVNSIYGRDFEAFGYPMIDRVAAFDDPAIVLRQPGGSVAPSIS